MLLLSSITVKGVENEEITGEAPGSNRDPAETSLITGCVNNTTGSWLDEADIRVEDSSDRENDTKTNNTGHFAIWVVPGLTKLTVFYHGYRGQNITFTAVAGQNPLQNFTLSRLGPELVTITGYVNSTGRAPLGGALVYITDGDTWENMTQTNATTGQYTINCVNGSVMILALKDGYLPWAKFLNVADNEVYYVNFNLSPPAMPTSFIKGYVKDAEGLPIEGMTVGSINDTHMFHNETMTNASGYYELGVIEDWLHLMTDDTNHFEFHEYFHVNENETVWRNITLHEKGLRTARFFGTVTDEETGDPIVGAEVSAEMKNEDIHWDDGVETNATGAFELFLYKGDYEVRISAEGYFGDDGDIRFNEGEEIEKNISLRKAPPAYSMIKGYIFGEDQQPMDVQAVLVFDMMNDTMEMVPTMNGYFEMPVWEARFMVAAMHQGFSVSGRSVYVPNGTEIWVNLTMYEVTSMVCGYVKNATGSPVEKAAVSLRDGNTISFDGFETDEDGYYEAPTHPGTFAMVVSEEESGPIDSGEYDPFVEEIVIPDESDIWMNVTLYESEESGMKMNLTFIDWDHISQRGQGNMSRNKTMETRLFFDSFIGNGDMFLDAEEVAELNDVFLDKMMQDGDGDKDRRGGGDDDDDDDDPFPEDTRDRFFVDGIHYELNNSSVEMGFEGFEGAWDAPGGARMKFYGEYNSSSPIQENLTHDIEINMSWRYRDEADEESFILDIPDGYGAMDWDEVENMSMEGSDPWVITPGYNPNKELQDDEEEVEGIDYVWIHAYVNKTYDVTDNSDSVGFCGESIDLAVSIAEDDEVNSVILEYGYAGENELTQVTLSGTEGNYTYNISIPENESRDIEYRFIIEIEPYFKLDAPHRKYGIIDIIDNIAPVPVLKADQTLVNTDTLVMFNASLSTDNIGIVSYNYSFGDGSYILTEHTKVVHPYNDTGNYTVVLEVADLEGNTAIATLVLRVINDTAAPKVVSTIPADNATGVDPDTAIEIVFSEDIVLESLIVFFDGKECNHTFDSANLTLHVDTNGSLEIGKEYNISISVSDRMGNRLEGYVLNFTVIGQKDYDLDEDGIPNTEDPDVDGDGVPNDKDESPYDSNYAVIGPILDADGNPVANATVTFVRGNMTYTALTGPDGIAIFTGFTDEMIPVDTKITATKGNTSISWSQNEPVPVFETIETQADEDIFPIWLVVLILLILVIIAVFIILIVKKKKPVKEIPEPELPETEEDGRHETMGPAVGRRERVGRGSKSEGIRADRGICPFCNEKLKKGYEADVCLKCGSKYDENGELMEDEEEVDPEPMEEPEEEFFDDDDDDAFVFCPTCDLELPEPYDSCHECGWRGDGVSEDFDW